MNNKLVYIISGIMILFCSCNSPEKNLIYDNPDMKIIFLHHSTGSLVWDGDLRNEENEVKYSMSQVPRLL